MIRRFKRNQLQAARQLVSRAERDALERAERLCEQAEEALQSALRRRNDAQRAGLVVAEELEALRSDLDSARQRAAAAELELELLQVSVSGPTNQTSGEGRRLDLLAWRQSSERPVPPALAEPSSPSEVAEAVEASGVSDETEDSDGTEAAEISEEPEVSELPAAYDELDETEVLEVSDQSDVAAPSEVSDVSAPVGEGEPAEEAEPVGPVAHGAAQPAGPAAHDGLETPDPLRLVAEVTRDVVAVLDRTFDVVGEGRYPGGRDPSNPPRAAEMSQAAETHDGGATPMALIEAELSAELDRMGQVLERIRADLEDLLADRLRSGSDADPTPGPVSVDLRVSTTPPIAAPAATGPVESSAARAEPRPGHPAGGPDHRATGGPDPALGTVGPPGADLGASGAGVGRR